MTEMRVRRLWAVKSDMNIKEVVALCESDDESTVRKFINAKSYDESKKPWVKHWFSPNTFDRFFATEDDAVNYRNAERERLQEMMPKVSEFILHMNDIEPSDDWKFERKDYLRWYADSNDDGDYYDDYRDELAKNKLLIGVVRRGMLNINAESVSINDVVAIRWNEERCKGKDAKKTATLILSGQREVTTRTEVEYDCIRDIFGDNYSEQVFVKNVAACDNDEDDD
ncbi:MAG: hypothetical protein IJ271_08475 [Bacteroidales bacterium]|nr:hypothetical protein [Bacteroidales bacterium]